MAAEQKEDRFAKPALPWAQDALAKKGISAVTIEYHYGKYHLGYVRKLNAQDRDGNVPAGKSIVDLIKEADGKIFNLAAQIYNHSFYWESMSADGGVRKGLCSGEADRGGFRILRRLRRAVQGARGRTLWQRMGVAVCEWRQEIGDYGWPRCVLRHQGRPDACAVHRCVGARVLHRPKEQPRAVHHQLHQRHQLEQSQ